MISHTAKPGMGLLRNYFIPLTPGFYKRTQGHTIRGNRILEWGIACYIEVVILNKVKDPKAFMGKPSLCSGMIH